MDVTLFSSIATAGFSVAFVHAALPTHWLPFVLAGRAQAWTRRRTLMIAALAGGGHVLSTVVLGVLVAALGIAVDRWLTEVFPFVAAGVLILFGLWYLRQQLRGQGHSHPGEDHDHAHPQVQRPVPSRRSDRTVILGLMAALSFSPCEGFLPVFVAGAREGWQGFVVLSVILAGATLAGMLLFTWLTLAGLHGARLERIERYENGIVGMLLCLLGLSVWLLET